MNGIVVSGPWTEYNAMMAETDLEQKNTSPR